MFEEQAVTEENKKPDFLFPNSECYHNFEFPAEDLTVLGAKTTCKDRWRQVTTEADRVDEKYLFTLQPGISRNQLKEMASEKVLLVVPEDHIQTFPKEYQGSLNTLSGFINLVRKKQERMPKHFIVNMKNEFNFNAPVGQFIEHADKVGSNNKEEKNKK